MQNWLCPSDRQLRMRACIARGWSTPRDAVASLTPDECAAVCEVLRRDRALRLLDWGRVGRASERVDRLRLAQRGDGCDSCRMCGRRLRFLRWLTARRCADCGYRFCEHCGAEYSQRTAPTDSKNPKCKTKLCKLCHEIRLLRAKSGAWFEPRTREPSPPPAESSPSCLASTVGPANQDAAAGEEATPLPDSPGQQPPILAANQRRMMGRKSLSHSDLPTEPPGPEENRRQRKDSRGHHHLSLHLGGILRHGQKSASCSHAEQVQCEYFPTELAE